MAQHVYTNNATTTLASGILSGGTSLSVAVGTGSLFPSPTGSQFFYCTLADTSGHIEVIKVTAVSGDSFTTITRGQDGTSARAWNAGDTVELRIVKGALNSFNQAPASSTAGGLVQFADAAGVVLQDMGTVAANLVIAGPASGPAAAPTARALTAADLPANTGGTGGVIYLYDRMS